MPARPVQISLDTELLRRVDSDPETQGRGRSAFIRSAIESYLRAKEKRRIDQQIERAYRDTADDLLVESQTLLDRQAWPDN